MYKLNFVRSFKRYAVIMLGFFAICQISIAQTPAASSPKILILGDSISAEYGIPRNMGWVALLEKRLSEKKLNYQVINSSISGETTIGGKQRITDLLQKHQPKIVVIELGGNDALRGLSLEQSRLNLESMVQEAKKNKAKVLLLGMKIPPNYGKDYSNQFEKLFEKVALKNQIPLVPFFLEKIAANSEMFQNDRIHPNQTAQPLLLDTMWPSLQKLL